MTVETLRKTYSKLSDAKIRELVENDVLNLTSEGLQVLKEEVVKRQLPLLPSIDNVFKDQLEINKLIEEQCKVIRDQPCPMCGTEEYKLNGIRLFTVVSFITVTNRKEEFHMGCYNCLMEKKRKAEDKTSLLGWWGIFGFSETHRCLKANDTAAEELKLDQPSTSLKEFAATLVQQEYAKTMAEIKIAVKDVGINGEYR